MRLKEWSSKKTHLPRRIGADMDVREWVHAWVWGVPGVTPAQVGASAALLTIDEWVEVLGAVDGVRAHRDSAVSYTHLTLPTIILV